MIEIIREMLTLGLFLTCQGNVNFTQCQIDFLTCVDKNVKIVGKMPVSIKTRQKVLYTSIKHCVIKLGNKV